MYELVVKADSRCVQDVRLHGQTQHLIQDDVGVTPKTSGQRCAGGGLTLAQDPATKPKNGQIMLR